jgi:signal transduction histidine kinase
MEMSDAELRDHAEEMLTAVVHDLSVAQTTEEQSRKSQGSGAAQSMKASGQLHADDRIQHGFTFRAVLAEFAPCGPACCSSTRTAAHRSYARVRRFNEAIDEALTESMDRFAVQTDLFRDQFIGVLSHDLRTPLAAVTFGAALLVGPEDHPERRGRIATRIITSAQRIERMIGDLLDLTRVRLGGTLPLNRRDTDLQAVCEEVLLEIRAAQPEAPLRSESRGDVRGAWDPDRLAQVVSNLVGNALQHGDGTPVTLTAAQHGDAVTLEVHNGGAPIPAEVLPWVFEPLRRGQSQGQHSIGFGLFIARAVVLAHGGDIHVTSSDAGTTFTVTLPRNR